jgi:hypothetical protein
MPDNSSIEVKEETVSITDRAFIGCSGLISVTIPEGVMRIGDNAFSGCSALTIVKKGTYGDNLTWALTGTSPNYTLTISGMGEMADMEGYDPWYSFIPNIRTIVIEQGVTSIGWCVFDSYSALTSVNIPEGVTSIGWRAFHNCDGLISVTIPASVMSIENGAFEGCSGLTSVTIPKGVMSIGDGAFSGCSGLTSFTIPDGVTSIGDAAFLGCSGLTSVTIPSSVTNIGSHYTFNDCRRLTSFTNLCPTPQTIRSSTFFCHKRNCILYVPRASLARYRKADFWENFSNIQAVERRK